MDQIKSSALIVVDDKILSQFDLYDRFSSVLNFPNYFGKNWNAFFDVMCDLSWLDVDQILIDVQSLPSFSRDEQLVFLSILNDIEEHWKKFDDKIVEIKTATNLLNIKD